MSTDFLWAQGTNGLLIPSPLTVLSTELNSLANAATALSSVGGSSGVFSNTNTGQGMVGFAQLNLGAVASALAAGACLSAWFLESLDGGSTFENTVSGAALARAPDIIIPLPATTITAGWKYNSQPIRIPAVPFMLWVQNNSGQTWASSSNTLKLAPYAMQY